MRIKHWQGYGFVEATKVRDNTCDLHIKVKGNHEWGICREDTYDVYNWLVKRFKRGIKGFDVDKADSRIISNLQCIEGYENGVDTCDYLITFHKSKPNQFGHYGSMFEW